MRCNQSLPPLGAVTVLDVDVCGAPPLVPALVDFPCTSCASEAQIPSSQDSLLCAQCRQITLFKVSGICFGHTPVPKNFGAWCCPYCVGINAAKGGSSATARSTWDYMVRRGLRGAHMARAYLSGFLMVDGFGSRIMPGSMCSVTCFEDRFVVRAEMGAVATLSDHAAADVVSFSVEGMGEVEVTSGGGFIGGGFGVGGMLTGVLMASALNAISTTRRRFVDTKAELTTHSASYRFRHQSCEPDGVATRLTPLRVFASRASRTPQHIAALPDAIDQLKRLGELKAAGVITAEDFETAKSRLLGSLGQTH